MTRKCSKCLAIKSLLDFHKDKKGKEGVSNRCKACSIAHVKAYSLLNVDIIKERRAERYANNKEEARVKRKQSYIKNKEKIILQTSLWAKNNLERVKIIKNNWKKRNIGVVNSATAKRRALKFLAQPNWLTKQEKQFIGHYYTVAKNMEKLYDEKYNVDHIVPLGGKIVCGLHVPWNLRVITSGLNKNKSNRLIQKLAIDYSAEYYRKNYYEKSTDY